MKLKSEKTDSHHAKMEEIVLDSKKKITEFLLRTQKEMPESELENTANFLLAKLLGENLHRKGNWNVYPDSKSPPFCPYDLILANSHALIYYAVYKGFSANHTHPAVIFSNMHSGRTSTITLPSEVKEFWT
jgi:hypothetical protein